MSLIQGRLRNLGLLLLSAALVAAGPVSVYGAGPRPDAPAEIRGYTQAIEDVTVGLPEAGRIATLKVEEGDPVRKGQVLLYLDKRLETLEVELRRIQLAMDAELEFARQRVEVLGQQYASAKRLVEDGAAISRESFEAKVLEYAEAKAEATRIQTRKQMERVELDLAREKLARRILKSPVSGTVAEILKRGGESVQAHEPVIRLVNASRGRFVGSTEETTGRRFEVGRKACLGIHAGTERIWRAATIRFVSPTVDTASGLVEVKAEFENPAPMVRLGSEATLTLSRPEAGGGR